MIIILDFAKTLAYRTKKNLLADMEMFMELTSLDSEKIKNAFDKNIAKLNIYKLEPFFLKTLEQELQVYEDFYASILEDLQVNPELSKKAIEIKKRSIRLAVYEDALRFLENQSKKHKIIIATEGKPSRRLDLENLQINQFISGIYISDEMGLSKANEEFFLQLLDSEKINPKETILVDDSQESLNSAQKCGIQIYKISREIVEEGTIKSFDELNL